MAEEKEFKDEYSSEDWKKLVADMRGKHARRMNQLLEDLPDKQFRIVYPKMLDFIQPKLQRQELIKQTKENSVLRIEVVTTPQPALGEGRVIDVEAREG